MHWPSDEFPPVLCKETLTKPFSCISYVLIKPVPMFHFEYFIMLIMLKKKKKILKLKHVFFKKWNIKNNF